METLIGFVSVAIAVIALRMETKRSRLAIQADVLFRLDERFSSEHMRKTRQTAAQKLTSGDLDNEELSDVLDFFSNIAFMVKADALDTQLAFDAFEYWLVRYWYASQDYVRQARQYDSGSWASVEYLVARFEQIKERQKAPRTVSADALKHFLTEEAGRKVA